jgi:hypothetical protein
MTTYLITSKKDYQLRIGRLYILWRRQPGFFTVAGDDGALPRKRLFSLRKLGIFAFWL